MDEPFPTTLKEFGYAFNDRTFTNVQHSIQPEFNRIFKNIVGQLRLIDPSTGLPGDKPFEFKAKDNHNYNQKRYEALGQVNTFILLKAIQHLTFSLTDFRRSCVRTAGNQGEAEETSINPRESMHCKFK